MKRPPLYWLIATWFGAGKSPIISGTVGSLAALPFAWVIQSALGSAGLCIASFLIFAIGWWASNEYLRHHPEKQDPGEIVVDEVAGQWLLLSLLAPDPWLYALGFILFRFFDIVKPWPVSWADRKVKGGLGVMLDDILAALMGIGLLLLIPHLFAFLPYNFMQD